MLSEKKFWRWRRKEWWRSKNPPPPNILLKAAKAPVDSNIISSPVNLTYYVNKKECYATVCQTVLFSFSHPQKKKNHWNISAKLHWTKTVQLLSSLTEPIWQKCKIIFIENLVWIEHVFLIFHRRKKQPIIKYVVVTIRDRPVTVPTK